MHVVLAGDSIFDNGAYVSGDPVILQLRKVLPVGVEATLLAVDGDVTSDVENQLARMPDGATHLIVSVGGNDALSYVGLLEQEAASFNEVLGHLQEIRLDFTRRYRAMVSAVKATGCTCVFCTIYDKVPGLPSAAYAALALFNEVILREVFESATPLIDLRLICDETTDYSVVSPIEPSEKGGLKIVWAVNRFLTESGSLRAGIFT